MISSDGLYWFEDHRKSDRIMKVDEKGPKIRDTQITDSLPPVQMPASI
jgi:hypothetical protein